MIAWSTNKRPVDQNTFEYLLGSSLSRIITKNWIKYLDRETLDLRSGGKHVVKRSCLVLLNDDPKDVQPLIVAAELVRSWRKKAFQNCWT